MSNRFFSDLPARPHLIRPGGLKGEVFDLRRELVTAFDAVAGSGGGISWSPAGNGNAETWAEVKEILDAAKAPISIFLLDPNQTYEIDESADLHSSTFNCAPGGNILLNIQDGVQLRNGGILVLSHGLFNGGMTVVFNSTGGAPNPLAWDTQEDPMRFSATGFGGGCDVRNDGTVPVIHVRTNPDGLFILILMNTARILPSTGFFVEVEDGASVFVAVANNGVGHVDDEWISAPGDPTTCLIAVLSDDVWNFQTMLGWPGVTGITIVNQPITMGGGSGPTSLRPVGALEPLIPGTRYWDIDLVPPRPVFWDGAMFVDALGVGPV